MATNNAINTPLITLGGTFTLIGAFTFAGTLTANTAVTYPVSGTLLSTLHYAAPGATARKIFVSNGTDWVASTETYATPGSSGNVMTSDGTNWISSAPATVTGINALSLLLMGG